MVTLEVCGRLALACVHLKGWPRILVGSIYLVTGAALKECNRRILAKWAEAVERAFAITGGDRRGPETTTALADRAEQVIGERPGGHGDPLRAEPRAEARVLDRPHAFVAPCEPAQRSVAGPFQFPFRCGGRGWRWL